MYPSKSTKIHISPAVLALLAAFIWLSSAALLAAVLLAALCHELGHYLALRAMGGRVEAITIAATGAEMRIAPDSRLSYGRELLATIAGPAVNLLLALLLAFLGWYVPILYLLAGVQLLLGIFNLLPVTPLDGGSILWLAVAWLTEPYTADRVTANVGLAVSVALLAMITMLSSWTGGGIFPVFMAIWLLLMSMRQKLRLG